MLCSVYGLKSYLFDLRVHVFGEGDTPLEPLETTPTLANPFVRLEAGPELITMLQNIEGVLSAWFDGQTLVIDIDASIGWMDALDSKVIGCLREATRPSSRVFSDSRSGEPYFEDGGLTELQFVYDNGVHI